MEYPDLDNGFQWRAEQLCPDVQIARRTETFDVSYASGKNLKLVQTTSHDNGEHYGDYVHVQGHVLFRRTGPSTPGPSVVLDVVVSDDRVNVHTAWDAEEQALLVTVPRGVSWSVAGVTRACVSITATVWVPEDAVLDRVVVEAVHLAIGLLDNLSLHVADTTKLSTVVGAITAAATGADAHDDNIIQIGAPASFRFYSRLIEATTTSAAIRGFWPLYDYLGLHSTSGTIKVAIDPKPSDKTYPKPATLSVKSLSGDVELREPVDDATSSSARAAESLIPPRDYRVDVHTTSGNIKAALAFSSTAALRSTSGAVRAQLLPVLDSSLAGLGKKSAWLETATTSGNVHLKVLEPLWVDTSTQTFVRTMSAPPFRCLYSEHRGVSADINLHYPASWEGDISLAATSGSLRVIGEDVKIIRSGHDWPGYNNRMLARKGEEGQGGNVRGKSTSGDIEVFVGGGE
ncbi:hypothetical protein B0T19DRAFT_432440 [Cercophora scortea]|uniref:Uncharacterized protein n=1 Tax=Cercophora scortea TaxID=314031 RepID=A0AAE0M762_9PEZI|nr:hypothetical protein B0T19DRAFT_432440 [Cercophora scortea]